MKYINLFLFGNITIIFTIVITTTAFCQITEAQTVNTPIISDTIMDTMNREEFWSKLNAREFDELFSIYESGVIFDFDLPQYTKQASWSKDYELLYFFWRIGADEETPFIGQVFEKFRNGVSYETLVEEHQREELEKRKTAKADLTESYSAYDIPIEEVVLRKDDDGTYSIIIHIEPYICDDYFVSFQTLLYDGLIIDPENTPHGKVEFEVGHFGNDNSIYLYSIHIPVDLISVEFKKKNDSEIELNTNLIFYTGGGRNQEGLPLILNNTIKI